MEGAVPVSVNAAEPYLINNPAFEAYLDTESSDPDSKESERCTTPRSAIKEQVDELADASSAPDADKPRWPSLLGHLRKLSWQQSARHHSFTCTARTGLILDGTLKAEPVLQVAGNPWLSQVQSYIGSPSQAGESPLRLMARSAPPTMERQPARPALHAHALRPAQVQPLAC